VNRVLLAMVLVTAALAAGSAAYAVHQHARRPRRQVPALPALPPVRVPTALVDEERVTIPPSSAGEEKAWYDFVAAHGGP
jgi:hypothetical protein